MTDRTYYRALPTVLLIEQALNSGNELAIALGERLEEYDHQEDIVADLQRENAELDRRADMWREELEALRAQLELN